MGVHEDNYQHITTYFFLSNPPKMSDSGASVPSSAEINAQNTLYVNNLNEKVSLNKLKPVLDRLFGRYGSIVDISAHRNLRMKGQAFITYKDARSSARAIRKLQGRPIYKKPIRVTYAKTASDEENKLLGNTEAIDKRKEEKKQREETKQNKKVEERSLVTPSLSKNQVKQWKSIPPHHILLLQNLQEHQLTVEYLEGKFSARNGFERIRLIKFRKLAFIDFGLESNATECLEVVDPETEFGTGVLLTYAKK